MADRNHIRVSLCAIVLGSVLLFTACLDGVEQDTEGRCRALRQQYGIGFEKISRINQLPDSIVFQQKNNELAVQLIPLTEDKYFNYLGIIGDALSKYPFDLPAKHLDTVYIGGGYRENGGIITGLYEKRKLFLFYNHIEGDNSSIFLEQTFHHEFSSILIRAYDFPVFEWLALNPKDFEYIINPVKINSYMNSIASYLPDASQLAQGLVSSYGKANAENDINTYVELIFTEPERMQAYIRKYPIIKKKYEMLKKFYLSISRQFDKVFF